MRKIVLFFIFSISIFLNTSFSEEAKNDNVNNLENEKISPQSRETNDDKQESEGDKEFNIVGLSISFFICFS